MEKTDKTPYILGALALFVLSAFSAYIYFNYKYDAFPFKRFIITLSVLSGLAIALGFGIYYAVSNMSKQDEKDISAPKEQVSNKKAIEIFVEELIKYNKIKYTIPDYKDNKIRLCDPDAIEIRDVISFTDPSMQTSDTFLGFEVIVREGTKIGTIVAVIPTDLGEDFIRENWNYRLRWNKAFNSYEIESKKYPLTSSKRYAERLQMKRVELDKEGYSESEIKEMIDPFLMTQRSAMPQQQIISQNKSKPPIKSAEVSDIYPQMEEEEKIEVSDIQEDIEEFRRRNK